MIGDIPDRHSNEESRYFEWIAGLPCIVSGAKPVQVAHVRGADSWWGKELPGMARKPSIPYVVPLNYKLHMEQERGNWRFWKRNGMDERPAQDSILFHCWWLWRTYQVGDATTSSRQSRARSQRIAERYLTRMRALRQN